MSDNKAEDTRSPEQIQKDIEATRARLTNAVDELSYRVDPRVKVQELKDNAGVIADDAKAMGLRFLDDIKRGEPKALGIVGGAVGLVALAIVAGIRTDD